MSRKSLAVASLLLIAFAAMAQGKVTISVTGYLGDYTPFSYSGALDLAVNPQTGQIVSKESNLVGFVSLELFSSLTANPASSQGLASASALGLNDFLSWLSSGTGSRGGVPRFTRHIMICKVGG